MIASSSKMKASTMATILSSITILLINGFQPTYLRGGSRIVDLVLTGGDTCCTNREERAMTERNIRHYKLLFPNGRWAVWYDLDCDDEPIMYDDETMNDHITTRNLVTALEFKERMSERLVGLGFNCGVIKIFAIDDTGNHFLFRPTSSGDELVQEKSFTPDGEWCES